MTHRKLTAVSLAALVGLAPSACKAPQAFGERNVVIVRADRALWRQVDSLVMNSLERRVFTTRPERTFEVTFVAADDTLWNELRLWKQVLVLGPRDDELVARLVDRAEPSDVEAPAVVQVEGVWARAPQVTVLLLPRDGASDAVSALLPELFTLLKQQYDDWIVERMYTSGLNEALTDSLARDGFTLQIPNVYLHTRTDSIFRFGNPYRQGDSDLLRSLLVTWRSGATGATPETLRAWRAAVGGSHYSPSQTVLDDGIRADSVAVGDLAGIELRGVWQDSADFPAAGPFIARAIACPSQNRTYYMDAWLFAPATDKYPYIRQLEILLDSFRCAASGGPVSSGASAAASGR